LNVKIYRDFGSELEDVWRNFESHCDHFVFQSYDWLMTWQKTSGEVHLCMRPYIYVVTEKGREVAIFPLGIRDVAGVKILEFLGGSQADYNAPLINPQYNSISQLRTIWRKVQENFPVHDVLSLIRIPDTLNHQSNHLVQILGAKLSSVAYSLRLPGTIGEFEKSMTASRLADSRRQMKRLSHFGRLDYSFSTCTPSHLKITEAMIKQKRGRYLETGVRDTLSEKSIQNFYLNLSGKLGGYGRIHVSSLGINDEILATHWGAIYGDRYYWLMPSYAGGGWRKFSAGRLLLENTIRWAIENGLKVFDFTIGGEEYKKIWCNQSLSTYDYLAYNSITGFIYVHMSKLVSSLKTNEISRFLLTSIVIGCRAFSRKK
jgi:CelD/BcsL family acetyltransferase involved in cellulose biosynthesis